MLRLSSIQRLMTYPVKVHLGHRHHPLDTFHYMAISARAGKLGEV